MFRYRVFPIATMLAATLAACGGGGGGTVTPPGGGGGGGNPTPTPTVAPTATPTSAPTPAATPTPTPMPTQHPTPTPSPTASPAQPQVIHVGFNLGEHTDPQFGPVYFYSTVLTGAQVIHVTHGSKVVFVNDDTISQPHTASGFGSNAFPMSFDNTSGFTQHGTTIDGSLTWSTGTLQHGQMSQVFTVGPPGHYYFGCGFHYFAPPTSTNNSMGDVLVST